MSGCRCDEELRELRLRVALLEASAQPEPWLDKQAVAKHYSAGVRTVEHWIREGAPMYLHEGKRKGLLSKVDPWLGRRGYLPSTKRGGKIASENRNGAAPRERPAPDTGNGGSDVLEA